MRKINEIFYSLQGEGYHTGTPALFIRFSGCNLRCPFCDTQHEEGVMMTDDAILEEVNKCPARLVILTGGEPSLWIDEQLIDRLHQAGRTVAIETNGTHRLPANIDWITCSPKAGGEVVIDRMNELKVVYQGQDLSQYDRYQTANRFLQPCSNQNIAKTIECIKHHPEWRLSLQTHLMVGIQ